MDNISKDEIISFYEEIGLPQQSYIRNDKIRNIYDILGIKPKLRSDGSRELTPYEILKVPPQMVMSKEIPIIFAIKNKTYKIGKYDGDERVFTYQSNKVKKELTLLQSLRANYRKAIFDGDEELAYRILQMYDKLTGGKAKEFVDSFYDYTKLYRRMKKQLLMDIFAHFFLMQEEQLNEIKVQSVKRGLVSRRSMRPFRNREFYGVPSITEQDIEEYERQQEEAQRRMKAQNERAIIESERKKKDNGGFWFLFSHKPNNPEVKHYEYKRGVVKNNKPNTKRKHFFNWEKLKRFFSFGRNKNIQPNRSGKLGPVAEGNLGGVKQFDEEMENPELIQSQMEYLKNLDIDINDLEKEKDKTKGLAKENGAKAASHSAETEYQIEKHYDYE